MERKRWVGDRSITATAEMCTNVHFPISLLTVVVVCSWQIEYYEIFLRLSVVRITASNEASEREVKVHSVLSGNISHKI